MASSYPSIQTFFQREVRPREAGPRIADQSKPSDGFTEEEIERALDPLQSNFNPTREYLSLDIGSLIPGPQSVTFTGRVVNFSIVNSCSKHQAAAKGWHHLIVKDDSGAISVSDGLSPTLCKKYSAGQQRTLY